MTQWWDRVVLPHFFALICYVSSFYFLIQQTDKRPLFNQLHVWSKEPRSKRRYKTSIGIVSTQGCVYVLLILLCSLLPSCDLSVEDPQGGGDEMVQSQKEQSVIKQQLVQKRKSPFLLYRTPEFTEREIPVLEEQSSTALGMGIQQDAGLKDNGYGKIRWYRIKYRGGDWDQDMKRKSDSNVLSKIQELTGMSTESISDVCTFTDLNRYKKNKAPALVYITGQRHIQVGRGEMNALRSYLLNKRGMIFADNGGSLHWQKQFFYMMRKVLPECKEIPLAFDHPIHRKPFHLSVFPIVAPHGGRQPYGWVYKGRLVGYYHPGDIGDAWVDGHSGVSSAVWKSAYQLACNIVDYAYRHSRSR